MNKRRKFIYQSAGLISSPFISQILGCSTAEIISKPIVKKIIGFKSGTGGSSGVEWLEKVTSHQFFPELWEIRNELS